MNEDLYTAEEIRQLLKLKSVQTVYRWGAKGIIPRRKIGSLVRFGLPNTEGQNNENRGKSQNSNS